MPARSLPPVLRPFIPPSPSFSLSPHLPLPSLPVSFLSLIREPHTLFPSPSFLSLSPIHFLPLSITLLSLPSPPLRLSLPPSSTTLPHFLNPLSHPFSPPPPLPLPPPPIYPPLCPSHLTHICTHKSCKHTHSQTSNCLQLCSMRCPSNYRNTWFCLLPPLTQPVPHLGSSDKAASQQPYRHSPQGDQVRNLERPNGLYNQIPQASLGPSAAFHPPFTEST